MKIDLREDMTYELAVICAQRVHAAVVVMHLRVASGIWPNDDWKPDDEMNKQQLKQVRSLVRGIRDKYDRYIFCRYIRTAFQNLREQKRTVVKWQDYVENVRRAAAEAQERRAA